MKKKRWFHSSIAAFLPARLGGVSAITGIAKKKYQRYDNKQKRRWVDFRSEYPHRFSSCKIIGLGTKGKKVDVVNERRI